MTLKQLSAPVGDQKREEETDDFEVIISLFKSCVCVCAFFAVLSRVVVVAVVVIVVVVVAAIVVIAAAVIVAAIVVVVMVIMVVTVVVAISECNLWS